MVAPALKFRHSQWNLLDFNLESIYECEQSKMTRTDASWTQESSTEEGTPYSANPLRPMTLFIEASMKISKIPREVDHFMATLFQWHSLALKDLQRHREAESLQGQVMETGSAGTQMDPTGFTGTQGLRHSTMRYLLCTEPRPLLLEAIYNPVYKCKSLIWKLLSILLIWISSSWVWIRTKFENLLIVCIYLLPLSRCLWQTVSAVFTHRGECSCTKNVTGFLMLWIWFGWFSSDTQCWCLNGSAELSLVYQSLFCHLIVYSVTYSLTFYFCVIFLNCRKNLNVSLTQCNDGEVQKEQQ